MELALSLERLNYEKLLRLWHEFEKHADAQASHFVEYMLEDQVRERSSFFGWSAENGTKPLNQQTARRQLL